MSSANDPSRNLMLHTPDPVSLEGEEPGSDSRACNFQTGSLDGSLERMAAVCCDGHDVAEFS